MRRLAVALLATVLLGTVAGGVPAQAANGFCAPGTGVSVVVDFGGLQDVIAGGCDPDGGGVAGSKVMLDAGFTYDYAQRFPGLVCRVNGKPAEEPCVDAPPIDAYWGLFWTDGTTGWKYSNVGIASLKVPEGGTIGWRWQNGGDRDLPRSAPNALPAPEPTEQPTKQPAEPSPQPTEKPNPQPSDEPSDSDPTPSEEPSASESPDGEKEPNADRDKGGREDSDEEAATDPTESPTATVTAVDELAPTAAETDDSGGGLLLGVGGLIVAMLVAAVVVLERRRRT